MSEFVFDVVIVSCGVGLVIFDVFLCVVGGEVLVLVGLNGVGKISLIELVLGVILYLVGIIMFDGELIDRLFCVVRVCCGIVYIEQGWVVFFLFIVCENIFFMVCIFVEQDVVLVQFLELEKCIDVFMVFFFGGEQQMVVLVWVFVVKLWILFIDEMLLGLVFVVFMWLMLIVQLIVEFGVGVLFVEQFMQFVFGLVEEVVVVVGGCVLFQGMVEVLQVDFVFFYCVYFGG